MSRFTPLRDHEAAMRESLAPRMAAPVWHEPAEHMVAADVDKKLTWVGPQGRTPFGIADAHRLIELATGGVPVVVDNPRTVRRIANKVGTKAARWFALMATLPLSPVIVATKALDTKLWHPVGNTARLRSWTEPLGIEPDNPWPVVGHMFTGVPNHTQQRYLTAIRRLGDKMLDSMTYGDHPNISSATMNRIYTSVSAATSCAHGVFAADAVRSVEMCHCGDASVVTLAEKYPTSVKAWLSSPCKLKPGTLMLFDGADSPGCVELVTIGWDSQRQSLYGIFAKSRTKVKGYAALRSAVGPMTLTAEPYINVPPPGASSVWASGYTAKSVVQRSNLTIASPGTSRTVPDDILALASGRG